MFFSYYIYNILINFNHLRQGEKTNVIQIKFKFFCETRSFVRQLLSLSRSFTSKNNITDNTLDYEIVQFTVVITIVIHYIISFLNMMNNIFYNIYG